MDETLRPECIAKRSREDVRDPVPVSDHVDRLGPGTSGNFAVNLR
jgi:hypothetical protein